MDTSGGNGQKPGDPRHGKPDRPGRRDQQGKRDQPGRPDQPGKRDQPGRPDQAGKRDRPGKDQPGGPHHAGRTDRAGGRSPARRSEALGSLTVPGRPEEVSRARAFVARTLAGLPGIDRDAATLLTSELVTNAIQHTRSGQGGVVRLAVTGLPDGVLVEVTDQGAPGAPVVKAGDLYAVEGHGLYLVQQVAGQWGYLRDPAGTTVWFHLPGAGPVPGQATRKLTPKATGNRPARAIAGVPGQRLRPAMSS